MLPKAKIFFFSGVYLFLCETLNCEIFSAIDELENLAFHEGKIMESFKVLARKMNNEYVDRKLISWEEEYSFMMKDVSSYITNPFNAFSLIRRCTADIELIEELFPKESKHFISSVKKLRPSRDDLTGAVEGLLRLQTVYKLPTEEFVEGIIDGQKIHKGMSAFDMFVIGEQALQLKNQEYFAEEYLFAAWTAISDGKDAEREVDDVAMLTHLITCYNRTGDYLNALRIVDSLIKAFPKNSEYPKKKKVFEDLNEEFGKSRYKLIDPFTDHFTKDGFYSEDKEHILYSQVCRGSVTPSLNEQAKLKCRFLSNSPFSKLARFKIEEINIQPYIVVFIDVLSDEEIELLKGMTKPKIERAETLTPDLQGTKSNIRVAKLAWIYDGEHEIIQRISKRIEDMTGLTQETAEALQVQNYGIGGHYDPHWDHRLEREEPFDSDGNRIASVLFYLTDVEKGGATVFPYLKVRIMPRKGTAVFWFNLKINGDSEYTTRHAGCPVVLGTKWVANKWIRENGQEFRRRCIPEVYVKEDEDFCTKDVF